MTTICFDGVYFLITTFCQLRGSFLPFWCEQQGFSVSTQGPLNDQQAVVFQRAQAMTEIAFVPLQRTH